jgi:hypothetical protein
MKSLRSNSNPSTLRRSSRLVVPLLLAVAGNAGAVVDTIINFESFPPELELLPGQVHNENGFTLQVVSPGSSFWIQPWGDPDNVLAIAPFSAIGTGDTLAIRHASDRPFRFIAYDFRSGDDLPSDTVDLVGLRNGEQTELVANLQSASSGWVTRAGEFHGRIDTLHIVGVQPQQAMLLLDNLQLEKPLEEIFLHSGPARLAIPAPGLDGLHPAGFITLLEAPLDTRHAYATGWFIRTDADTTQVRQPAPDVAVSSGNVANFQWHSVGAAGLQAWQSVVLHADPWAPDNGGIWIRWILRLTNPTSTDLTVDVFAYADQTPFGSYDVSADLMRGNDWLRAFHDKGYMDFHGVDADLYRVAPYPDLAVDLNDDALDLDNSGTPFQGDYTAAFQWQKRLLPANGQLTFEWMQTLNLPATVDTLFADGFESIH